MKRVCFLVTLLLLLTFGITAFASGIEYPCFSQTPYDYTVSEFPIVKGEKSIYGQVYIPEGDGPFPTIIMSHGFNGNAGSVSYIANALASSGFACYAYDFCGGNTLKRSSGKTTEMSALTEKEDLFDVMDEIKAQPFCDADHLFLLGESLGGLVTALAVAERGDEVKAVVLHYPAFSMVTNTKATYASVDDIPSRLRFSGVAIGTRFYGDVLDIDIDDVFAAYAGPVHILHGDADELVPLESSQDAVAKYPNGELTVMEGQGHGLDEENKAKAARIAYDLFSSVL